MSLALLATSEGCKLPETFGSKVFHNDHLARARDRFAALGVDDHGRSFERYSLALEHAGLRVVYSGNLRGAAGVDEMRPFGEPADLRICELAHLDPGMHRELVRSW